MQKLYATRGVHLDQPPRRRTYVSLLALFFTLFIASASFAQTVTTDKADYAPGETAIISGSGWYGDQNVFVTIVEEPVYDLGHYYTVTVTNGDWQILFPIEERHFGVKFTVYATGAQSGTSATASFTDGINSQPDDVTICAGSNASFVVGTSGSGAANCKYTWYRENGATDILIGWVDNITTTATNGIYSLSRTGGPGNSGSGTLTINGAPLSHNGYQYYCIVEQPSGTSGSPSNLATLIVVPSGTQYNGIITGSINSCSTVNNGTLEFFGSGTFERWEKRTLINIVTNTWTAWSNIPSANQTTYNLNSNAVSTTTQFRVITTEASCGTTIGSDEYESQYATISVETSPLIFASNITSYGVFDPYFGQDQAGPPAVDGNVDVYSFSAVSVKYYLNFGTPGQTEITYPYVFPVGTTTVTVQAINNCGSATATFNVTVGIPAQITCPGNIVQNTDPGVCKAVVTYTLTYDGGTATATPAAGHYIGNPEPTISYSLDGSTYLPGTGSGLEYPKGTTTVWLKAENSGATATCSFTITVEDHEPPTFTAPADITIYKDASCNYDASTSITGDVTDEADNCGVGEATFSDNIVAGPCEGSLVITRTWSLADDAGNAAADQVQTITVSDNTAPTFTAPPDITIYKDANCAYDADISITGDVTDEADNCDGSLDATFTDVVTAGTCVGEEVITRTWSLTDDCGNTTTHDQVITAKDNTAPTFTAPADKIIYKDANCDYNADPSITGDVTDEADNCDHTLDATYTDVVTAGACDGEEIITRTWSLTDDCGNNTTHDQIITAKDFMPPTFTVPADITIYKDADCLYNADPSITGDVTDEADNCDMTLDATYTDEVAPGSCEGEEIITRTWSLTDDCGNNITKGQIITVKDNTAPTFTAPADITIYTDANCSYDGDPSNTGDVTDEADNCSTGLVATYSDVVVAGPCVGSKVITRTWSLVDNCGNAAADQVQTITVSDNTAPVITDPADITQATDAGSCEATVTVSDPTVADNCDPNPTVEGTRSDGQPLNAPYPFGTTTISWIATDACGNVSDPVTQDVIIDKITPVMTVAVSPSSQQYSDNVTITATLVPPQCAGSDPICGSVIFKIGSVEVGTGAITIVGNEGIATWTGCIPVGPGTYDVSAIFEGCGNFAAASATATDALTVTPEDADGEYIGLNFAQTSCATCEKAKVTLSATIWDLQSVDQEDDADGCGGDISKALVRFIVEPTGGGTSYTSPWLPVGLIDPNDPLRGTATISGVELTEDSYTITVEIGGYYTGISEIMSTLVISKPSQTDFITGGGYVIPTNSSGLYATNYEGSKTNFGFNIKYNKSGKKLQGNFNLIFRRKEGGEIKTYQIKGTTCATLTVDETQTKATFSGKGNLAEIIDGVPYGIQGGATLIVDVTDNGEPGTGKDPVDMIAVTLLNKNGGLFYSTNWVGTKSEQMLLDGGNIQVNGSRVAQYTSVKIEPTVSADQLEVKVSNNPSHGGSAFRIQLVSNDHATPINLKVMDINGRGVEMQRGIQHGATVEVGRGFRAGMYMLEVVQGDQRKLIKLIKQ